MKQIDIVCDICGKKRGRPNNHDKCAIARKAKHAEEKPRPRNAAEANYNERNITGFVKLADGTYYD